jgi:hypothetical protein
VIYLPTGGTTSLDLSGVSGRFEVSWFNPRNGGPRQTGGVASVSAGGVVALGEPPDNPSEDWTVVLRR